MEAQTKSLQIWIDADACPKVIKEILFRAAERRKVKTILVANRGLSTPASSYISSVQVEKGFDVADHYIQQHATQNDIVITADIPLAALIVEKGAVAISPRGRLYTEENVQERLSVRNFMADLRDEGVNTGGPAAFGSKEKRYFAGTLDRILTQKLNEM